LKGERDDEEKAPAASQGKRPVPQAEKGRIVKRYSVRVTAGVPFEIDYPGRFFTLLGCITPVDVALQSGAQQAEVMEQVVAGIWCEMDATFTRVRIVSPTDQDVVFMVSMIRAGWAPPPASCTRIDIDIAGLAASATYTSSWIDLGDNWADMRVAMQFYGTNSANCLMTLQCAPDATGTGQYTAPVFEGVSGGASASFSATSQHISSGRPTNRFIRMFFQNGATPQAAGARLHLGLSKNLGS
jgi:hypothetical protein